MSKHSIYIAGPEVFYRNGQELLGWMKLKSFARGFDVSLPNDTQLDLGDDLQANAREIYRNCQDSMNVSDSIICDLENYRGAEPDGGSVFELGMAFARGIRLYGYTRDKRPLLAKDPNCRLVDGHAIDERGWVYPYAELPFAPSIMGSTVVVEGDYASALARLEEDLEADERAAGWGLPAQRPSVMVVPHPERRRIYLATAQRYAPDAAQQYAELTAKAAELGIELVTPQAPSADGTVRSASEALKRWIADLTTCDFVLADLADFRGWEPSADVSFECGVAAQLGMPCLGFMPDVRPMIDRVPHLGADHEYRDLAGAGVENFDYPINLMFSGYMPIIEADAIAALREVAKQLGS